jgi:hypothetical protein
MADGVRKGPRFAIAARKVLRRLARPEDVGWTVFPPFPAAYPFPWILQRTVELFYEEDI